MSQPDYSEGATGDIEVKKGMSMTEKIAIGFGILAVVGLVTYGIYEYTKKSDTPDASAPLIGEGVPGLGGTDPVPSVSTSIVPSVSVSARYASYDTESDEDSY